MATRKKYLPKIYKIIILYPGDIDAYNKSVNDYNASINSYNQLNTNINNKRSQVLDNWNNSDKQFMDTHIPHMKS